MHSSASFKMLIISQLLCMLWHCSSVMCAFFLFSRCLSGRICAIQMGEGSSQFLYVFGNIPYKIMCVIKFIPANITIITHIIFI